MQPPSDPPASPPIKTEFRGYLELADRDNTNAMKFIRQTLQQRVNEQLEHATTKHHGFTNDPVTISQPLADLTRPAAPTRCPRDPQGALSTTKARTAAAATNNQSVPGKKSSPKLKNLQRQRSRANQRRFRDKESSKQYNLMLDVNQLKQQIADLEMRRKLLLARSAMDAPENARVQTATAAASTPIVRVAPLFKGEQLLKTMFYYYDLFHKGLSTPNYGDSLTTRAFRDKQIRFFKWLFAPQVARGDVNVTVDVLLEQWERLGRFYSGYTMEHVSTELIEVSPTCLIVNVKVMVHFRITHTTLANVFPQVLQDPKLLTQVLGRQVQMPMETSYFFDVTQQQVVRMAVNMDLITAITNVVRKAEKTSEFMQGALITGNFFLGQWTQDCFGVAHEHHRTWSLANQPVHATHQIEHHHELQHQHQHQHQLRECAEDELFEIEL